MTIQDIKKDLITLGLGDNTDLALLVYLAAAIRGILQKISILVTGPSGAGKSYLVKTVLDLFPKEDIIAVSKMTPAALVRYGDLSDKVLFVYEKFRDELFAQYIRELISEGEVIYPTANELYHLKGPITLIETTVNPYIVGIENKSRCFVVSVNTSEKVRNSILERQKALRTLEGLPINTEAGQIQSKHRGFHKSLDKTLSVVIPFAKRIKFASLSQHASRILERIMNIITAIAFIEQANRPVKESSGHRYVEAIENDYKTAKEILCAIPIDDSESVLPEDTIEFTEILRRHREFLSQLGRFTRAHIFDIIGKSHYPHKSSKIVIKHLSILSQIGYIDEVPVRGLKNRCEYSFGRLFPSGSSGKLSNNCYETLSLL